VTSPSVIHSLAHSVSHSVCLHVRVCVCVCVFDSCTHLSLSCPLSLSLSLSLPLSLSQCVPVCMHRETVSQTRSDSVASRRVAALIDHIPRAFFTTLRCAAWRSSTSTLAVGSLLSQETERKMSAKIPSSRPLHAYSSSPQKNKKLS